MHSATEKQSAGQRPPDTSEVIFINHSCVLVRSGQTAVLCDPWFKGAVFNNSWRLLFEDSHRINEIVADHIWISHEHPDHFSLPTLAELAAPRSFLYQQSSDRKVADFLRKKQKVTEIADGESLRLGDMTMTTFTVDDFDTAALFVFDNGTRFLNVNDARVELGGAAERIRAISSEPLDLVAVQFSVANWSGNPGDAEIQKDQQDLVIQRILKCHALLKPKRIMLFASYVYRSHEENFFSNGGNPLPYVTAVLKSHGISPIVPRPDQCIDLRTVAETDFEAPNREAMAFWQARVDEIAIRDFTDQSKTLEDLRTGYRDFYRNLWADNVMSSVRTPANAGFRLRIWLTGIERIVEIGLFDEVFEEYAAGGNDWDCKLSCESLLFMLRNKFGRGTITINGRIEFNYPTAHRFFIFFFAWYKNNIGRYFRDERLTASILNSIENTAVMSSILKFNSDARRLFAQDLQTFPAA